MAHSNKWFRQQALRQFGDRKDALAIASLTRLLQESDGQLALEALWALNLSGGFDEEAAAMGLAHRDPFVRMWAVRLLGDKGQVPAALAHALARRAQTEPHPEVRSQLASSAKRLPAAAALPVLHALMRRDEDADDPHNPLLIWWALEAKAEEDREGILALLEDEDLWEASMVQQHLLERLMQRYLMAGGAENLAACSRLLELAPDAQAQAPLMAGLMEGLRGQSAAALPEPLVAAMEAYQQAHGGSALAVRLRRGEAQALEQALQLVGDPQADRLQRLTYLQVLAETAQPAAVPTLLEVVGGGAHSPAMKQAALHALARYEQAEIGQQVVNWYPDRLRAEKDVKLAALTLLASRASWAQRLVEAIEQSRKIHADDVPVQLVQQVLLLDSPGLAEAAARIWPEVQPATSAAKAARIEDLKQLLRARSGQASAGKALFQQSCGSCHQLFGEGGNMGPDLTGYDRRNLNYLLLHIVDPHAEIREGYVNYLVQTRDGRSLSGTLVENNGKTIVLKTFDGQELTLGQSQIVEMKAQPVSLMPERLLDALSEQEVADLFAYLQTP